MPSRASGTAATIQKCRRSRFAATAKPYFQRDFIIVRRSSHRRRYPRGSARVDTFFDADVSARLGLVPPSAPVITSSLSSLVCFTRETTDQSMKKSHAAP